LKEEFDSPMGYERRGRKRGAKKEDGRPESKNAPPNTPPTGEKTFRGADPRVYPKAAKAVSSQTTEKK